MWYLDRMSVFWTVFAGAIGIGAGGAYMARMREKHGKVPLWWRGIWLAVALVVIYLGALSLGPDSPFTTH